MTYSYFPGCTLKNKAKDLDKYARECAKVLGFELEEIPEWQCCGAVYPLASDEIATKQRTRPERCKSKGTGFGNGLFRLPSCNQTRERRYGKCGRNPHKG